MAPFDRESALKAAEKAIRQGRIDVAIAQYLRIIEAQPRDWNAANALGDLYIRASQVEQGIAQYTRIADHLAAEGFFPKASALYKKILKIKPDQEYALLQSGEIAARLGLFADAKNAFRAVADRRASRGDTRGAAEIGIRIGTLDPNDLETRLRAARAAEEIGDSVLARREFREVGLTLEKQGRTAEALAAFQAAFDLSPADAEIRGRLLSGYLQAGDVARARTFLGAETAGSSAPLWLTLAEIELRSGRIDQGRSAAVQALSLDPSQRAAVIVLGCRLAEQSPDAGYSCIDVAADAALAENDYAAAAAALNEFVARVRHHLIALMRLVEICVDGGLEATTSEAQAQLADAYLELGRGLEARIISEDLIAREPWNRASLERFRRAIVLLGEADPDSIIAERLSGDSPFLTIEQLDLNEGVLFEAEPPPASPSVPQAAMVDAGNPSDCDTELVVTLPQLSRLSAPAPRSLEQVFKQRRDEVGREPAEEAAAEQYHLALTYRELGMIDETMQALEVAVRSPRQRFDAAALLGALSLERQDILQAIEWFERAAEAPAPTPDANAALLYDLADTLETAEEHGRALAVFVELEADFRGYRDVADRIDRLSNVQAKR